MKRIYYITLVIGCILTLGSCRKEDNPKLPDLTRVPVPLLTLKQGSTLIIEDNAAKDDFKSTFDVSLYYPDDTKPQKYDIVVARNGDYEDVKTYQSGLTALPSTIEVTTEKLAQLFGMNMSELIPGTYFEVRSSFTLTDGTVIPAFNTIGETYGTDLNNLPGSNLSLKYQIVCALDLSVFTGQFDLLDANGFWEEDYVVTLTPEGTDKLRLSGFLGDPSASFLIEVDRVNRTVTVPKQIYAPGEYLFGYHNFAIAGKGEIDACNNKITFNGAYSVDEGNFGSYPVRLVKK